MIEESVVVISRDDEIPELDISGVPFHLNFQAGPKSPGTIRKFRGGYRQDFDIGRLLNEIPTDSWGINFLLTALGVARAETLGSSKVYVPNSYFGIGAFDTLNQLVEAGTDPRTQIEVVGYGSFKRLEPIPKRGLPFKSLVLASGGIDSTMAAVIEKGLGSRVGLLQVIYQQSPRHQECWAVDQLMTQLSCEELVRLEFEVLKHFGGSALLDDKVELNDTNLGMEYVPFRNTILLAYGLIIASMKGYSRVILGAQPDDTMAPDVSRPYIHSFNNFLTSLGHWTPEIDAPLLYFGGKPELIRLGLELGMDFSRTWSCHSYVAPKDVGKNAVACGTCGNCITRYSAFRAIGEKDPIAYRHIPKLKTDWAGQQEKYESIRGGLHGFR